MNSWVTFGLDKKSYKNILWSFDNDSNLDFSTLSWSHVLCILRLIFQGTKGSIIVFIPYYLEIQKHCCFIILGLFGSLIDCQNGYAALLWFAVSYLWISAVSHYILNWASQCLMLQHPETELKRQQNVGTASLAGTSSLPRSPGFSVPLLERLWQMELLLAWAAASGDFSSDQWYPHPDLSLPGWAFKPWNLLGDVVGSQPQPACANSSIAWHTRCRQWTSVCEQRCLKAHNN